MTKTLCKPCAVALAASGKKFKPEIKCCGACTGCAMAGSCENKEEETK